MIYYLAPCDLLQIRDTQYNTLGIGTPKFAKCVQAAKAEIISYLHRIYITDGLFIPVHEYHEASLYTAGQLVYDPEAGGVFEALEDVKGVAPSEDTGTTWKVEDRRHAYFLMLLTDIAKYHAYAESASRQIPEDVKDRYNNAIDYLKDCSRGKATPDLPERQPEGGTQGTTFYRFGNSSERLGHRY